MTSTTSNLHKALLSLFFDRYICAVILEFSLFYEGDGFSGKAESGGFVASDFDEDYCVTLFCDKVDLTVAAAEVGFDDLITAALKLFRSQILGLLS